ncbi:MAG TPA: hypothetical protein VNE62_07855 [Actinomycetota bacterium]|nr:hypothetical protein [Actinomycetota bacterium]
MSGDNMSMREASRVLGVSQIRVRELVRKGTLRAEKIVENGTERWAIFHDAVQEFLARRTAGQGGSNGSGGAATKKSGPPISAAAATDVATLVSGLQRQLDRVRKLTDELAKATQYVDRLKAAQKALEGEIASAKGAKPGAGANDQTSKAPKGKPQAAGKPQGKAQQTPEAGDKPQAAADVKADDKAQAATDGKAEDKQQTAADVKADDKAQDAPDEAKAQAQAKMDVDPAGEAPEKDSPASTDDAPKAPKAPKTQDKPQGKGSKTGGTGGKAGDGPKAKTAMGAALRDAGVNSPAPSRPPKKPGKKPE